MEITLKPSLSTGKTKAHHTLVIVVSSKKKLGPLAAQMDKKSGGLIGRAVKSDAFSGKSGSSMFLPSVEGLPGESIAVMGVGDESKLDNLAWQSLGGHIVAKLQRVKAQSAEVVLDAYGKNLDLPLAVAETAYGARLRSYRFDKYRTKEKPEDKSPLKNITFITEQAKVSKALLDEYQYVADGVELARNVVTEPGNIIYPETLANECMKLKELGVKIEVLGEAQMQKLGMGSLLGVGQGSARESKLVVIRWEGGKKSVAPIAFVGKGVTFDTGGISIKPAQNMEDMKYDMGGSAAVIGTMKALAGRKAKANVVGVVGLVENMPDGNAQRPGDVVTSMSGQTIEVLNTDAEGRLVLADALWYTQSRFKPQFMINLATLTGAIVVALADVYCGLFSNNDELCEKITASGNKVGERAWRFPLGEEYDRMINSDIADMKNIGDGRGAGSITAAQFLQRFVNDTPWAHLDIAGMAWTKKGTPVIPKGASGFGVRLLNQIVKDYYEK